MFTDLHVCTSVRDGHLFIDDLDTNELAERFGTPLFVLSETQLRMNVRRFRSAFAAHWIDGPVDVLPAFKANTTLASRQVLTGEGCGADIYSAEELEGVLRTPVDPTLVSVNGGGKGREHLARCVREGVRITVEDVHEVELIQEVAGELGMTARIRLRVKPTVPKLWQRTDFSQATVPIDLGIQLYKSGIPPEYLVELGRKAIAAPNVEMVGIHMHQGRHHSGLRYWRGLMTVYGRMIGELSKAWGGWQPEEIDIGGGWPSPRDPLNEEMARSEFLLTAAGYPALVALRGIGARGYHKAMSVIVPALTSHTAQAAAVHRGVRRDRGGDLAGRAGDRRDPNRRRAIADRAGAIALWERRHPPGAGQGGQAADHADSVCVGADGHHLVLPRRRALRAQPLPARGRGTCRRPAGNDSRPRGALLLRGHDRAGGAVPGGGCRRCHRAARDRGLSGVQRVELQRPAETGHDPRERDRG